MDEEERKRKMDDGVAGILFYFIFVDFCQVVGGAALSLGPRTIQ